MAGASDSCGEAKGASREEEGIRCGSVCEPLMLFSKWMATCSNYSYLISHSVGAPVDTTKEVSVCWLKISHASFVLVIGSYCLLTAIIDSGRESSGIEKL